MNDNAGCLGGLIVLAVVVAVLSLGGLLITSKAILYSEERMADDYFGKYRCTYFTGTRSIVTMNNSETGCPRLIDVGR